MNDFIGKKIKVEYIQETGSRRPVALSFDQQTYKIIRIIRQWEEHTLGKPWWSRKHRVWYELELDGGNHYQIYWDRGASGKGEEWYLVKSLSKGENFS